MTRFRIEQSADAVLSGLIFLAATGVVMAVAAFAAVVSYTHIYDLAVQYGHPGTAARLTPLSIDGVILSASLMMLYRSRQGLDAPLGIRAMLWAGVGATLAANAASGVAWGLPGILIAVCTGAAFVACVEALMWFIREKRGRRPGESSLVNPTLQQLAHDAREAAQIALKATMAAGNPYSQRYLMANFGISRDEEREMREAIELELGVRQPVLEPADGAAPAAS